MPVHKICIVGGGIIGLMQAYYLRQNGYDVTVIDATDITTNTSFGNAGLLSPFEKYPLSYPGVVTSTLKLMIERKSPLIIHPSLDPKLYRWLWKFVQNANPERLKKTLILFERYGEMAMEGYEKLQNEGLIFEMYRNGLLLLFTEQKSYQMRKSEAEDSPYYRILTQSEIENYVPVARKEKIAGALLLKRNGHISPGSLMRSLKYRLREEGVKLHLNTRIESFERDHGRIRAALSSNERFEADLFIMATGADLSLAEDLGRNPLMIPAKGYSLTFEMEERLKPKTATMFYDIFTILSPRKEDVRITSKLELNVADQIPHHRMIEKILATLKEYTVDFELKNARPWAGVRPLTPNDMPLIGRDEAYHNLVWATGLGWLGITFAPAIAQILTELITKEQTNAQNDDILLFSGFYQGC
ncbi:MAG: hypothetical protein B6D59_04515 [Campylobacteraceae bacterium 4484_4]|nr:MAG: hypothetical protein B6D59_04515 [Campylobacteraceae bacterium 4484_4]